MGCCNKPILMKRSIYPMTNMIATYKDSEHRAQVITLWQQAFGYEADHNEPGLVIDKKLAAGDGLFFVAMDADTVVGTVMAGYDGHRGWIYSIAVLPDYRKQMLGSRLLEFAERKLSDLGCMKVNLQIMADNAAVENFYLTNGYHTEKRISMGKRLPGNIPS